MRNNSLIGPGEIWRYLLWAIWGLLSTTAASGAELPGLAAAARSLLGADQGVYVQAANGTILLAQNAARAVHPASVSKIPTTLALLRKFGPEHRFITTFATSGPVVHGTLYGDLWVEGDGDPALVDEDALLVAERLHALGIERIAGTVRSRETLIFDWQSDPDAVHLGQALSGLAPAAARAAVHTMQAASSHDEASAHTPAAIQFVAAGPAAVAITATPGLGAMPTLRPLVVYRSQPLLSLAKSLNDYSNNIFNPFASLVGGAAAVQAVARSAVPASMRSEIILGDGAGADPRNRLSPRAAVMLLQALDQELARTGHALFEILPVAGVDDGTLRERLNAPQEAGRVVGKTGTFGDYGASALIGAISTRDRGTVYFAILNHGVPVAQARRRQNQFVHALLAHLHSQPWSYQRDARPAIARAEISIASP